MNEITYKGDHVKDLHNRILGPDEFGAFYVVTDSTFENDETTAQLRPATQSELENAKWDKSGVMFLADPAPTT
jgi:hypothetical protein